METDGKWRLKTYHHVGGIDEHASSSGSSLHGNAEGSIGMKRLGPAILLLTFVPAASLAATIHVPGDFPIIQAAIDAAKAGDTVLVHPETYKECIDFKCARRSR